MIIVDRKRIFSLREIKLSDIESLRVWKNKHRNSFFHKDIISPEQQEKWFNSYLIDENNVMFVVMLEGKAIGCMGYRIKGDTIDVYNIMRGVDTSCDNFTMSDAFQLMLNYINDKYRKKISCVVLNDNPAFQWYLKNEFIVLEKYKAYSLLEHRPKSYQNEFTVKES